MTRLIALLLCLVLEAPVYAAAPTYDTASSDSTGTTSTSHSHTFAAGTNLALIFVTQLDAAPAAVVGVTVAGQAATLVTGCARTQSTLRTEIWYYLSPPSGAQTVAADTSGTTTDATFTSVISLSGAATSSTFSTCVLDGTSDSTVTITGITTTVNDFVVGVTSASGSRTCSAEATSPVSTERVEGNNGGNVTQCVYTEAGGASTTDININLSASVTHADVGVAVRGAADAVGALRRRL
jgi:hypothetical protein